MRKSNCKKSGKWGKRFIEELNIVYNFGIAYIKHQREEIPITILIWNMVKKQY